MIRTLTQSIVIVMSFLTLGALAQRLDDAAADHAERDAFAARQAVISEVAA